MNDFSKSSLVRSEQNLQNYQLTEIGYIPKDWNVLKLESLVTYRNGVAHEDCIESSGEYVVVNSKFISTDGEVKKYSSQCRLSALSREILMVMSDVPNGKAIAKCYFVKDDDRLTINQRICALKSNNSDSKYLFYVLNRNAFYLAFDDGAKQTNLRRQDVLDCPLAIPSRQEEQTAIANALSDVDALILELEKLIAKKQAIKTATMQQLLTGRTRLPQFAHHPDGRKKGYKPSELGEIPEDWSISVFEKLCRVFTKQTGFDYSAYIKPSLIQVYRSGYIPFIQNKDFCAKSINFDTDYYIPRNIAVNFPNIMLDEKSLLVSISGSIGNVGVFENQTPSFIGGAIAIGKFYDPELIDWVMFYMLSEQGQRTLFGSVKSGSHQNLTLDDIRGFLIPFPSKEEQSAITMVLSDIQEDIQTLEKRLNKTRQIKQGMMQELLTGKTRLVKPAGAA